jgi:hypothetical protein
MDITRELLTGNIHLTLEVYATPGESDHPARFKITITPQRLAQIRQMAVIVREHKHDGLNIWSLRAWDYSGDWLAYAEDDDGNEIEGEPERMECCAIVVSDEDFYYEASVKNCDIHCETEYLQLSALSDSESNGCTCDHTPKPYRCPLHGEISYVSEDGNRDERLRTTD